MTDPNEIGEAAQPHHVSGEDLLELSLVLRAFGADTHNEFDVAITPKLHPDLEGVEYHIVVQQP